MSAPPPPIIDPGPFTDHERFSAMLSVHAHARRPDRDFLGLPILPLDRAISILKSDTAAGAASRRRRAVAKLYGYAPNLYRAEIAQLGVNVVRIEQELAQLPGPQRQTGAMLERAVVNLPVLLQLAPDCLAFAASHLSGEVDPTTPVHWEFELLVPRRVIEVARALDPQSWDQCPVYYFRQTHLVSPKLTAVPCCATGTQAKCDTDPDGDGYVPAGPAEPAGKPYGPIPLYEHFCVGQHCHACAGSPSCLFEARNVLCVTTEYDSWVPCSCFGGCAERYTATYELADWVRGELGGNENVEMTQDFGTLWARVAYAGETVGLPDFDWTKVHVDKTVSFGSQYIDRTAAGILSAQIRQDELRGQVMELACCRVPEEKWCDFG